MMRHHLNLMTLQMKRFGYYFILGVLTSIVAILLLLMFN